MQVAALLFDKLTVLDIVGPTEVLSWLPDTELVYVGKQKGPVIAAPTGLTLSVDHTMDEITKPDILIVPGGPGVRRLVDDEETLEWIRNIHGQAQWTTSVCTGSILLASAGLLNGLTATTHWNAVNLLTKYGAQYVEDRVVRHGKIVTSAGVSSGIDMAIHLVEWIAGPDRAKAVQLAIEYDPQPPFNSGAPSKASAQTIQDARQTVETKVSEALA